jgi:hypothetical protein
MRDGTHRLLSEDTERERTDRNGKNKGQPHSQADEQTESGQHAVNEMKEGQHLQMKKEWHMNSSKQSRAIEVSKRQTG